MAATTILFQARQALGLRSNIGREAALRDLKAIRKGSHPDSTGGEFESDAQKTRYLLADGFINALEREVDSIQNLPALKDDKDVTIELLRALVSQSNEGSQLAAADRAKKELVSVRSELEKTASQPFQAPKFSLWGLGAIGMILVTAQAPIESIGVRFGADSSLLTAALTILSTLSVIAGFLIQSSENLTKQHVRQLLTDRGIALVVAVVNDEHNLYGNEISLDDFTEAVSTIVGTGDHASCEEAARVISSQLTERGLLRKLDAVSFSQQYQPTDEIRRLSLPYKDQAKSLIRRREIRRTVGPLGLFAAPIFAASQGIK